MSLKSQLKRVEKGVRWLETEGAITAWELKFKLFDIIQKISDDSANDPEYRAQWNERVPNAKLPPPRVKPKPPPPRPVPARPPPPSVAPVQVAPVAPVPPPSPPSKPVPKPEPIGGFNVEPAMQIAPVFWRKPGMKDPWDG